MGPLFNRVVSETLEEETSNPVTMSAVKMEEVGVFSESVNRELEWNDSHLGCQWSRNGRHFAAGGGEGVLLVYDYDGDMMTSKLFSSYGCGNEILALDWSYPSASAPTELLLYGLQGGGLGIFNVMTSSVLREMTVDTASAIVDVAFSPQMNGYAAATVGASVPMTLWDMASGKISLEASAPGTSTRINCIEYIPTGAGIFCGGMDGCIRLFDARSGKVASEGRVSSEPISGLQLVVNTPADGSATLFCCSTDGIVREFDFRNLSTISFLLLLLVT